MILLLTDELIGAEEANKKKKYFCCSGGKACDNVCDIEEKDGNCVTKAKLET